MMPRSLANYMNAYTATDYTAYPFATTNTQDFQNLTSVYLDATLHPLLREADFHQEGWRLALEDPSPILADSVKLSDRLRFKGVVYNEMKGQMSDASYLYYIRFLEFLYPDINNSAGDPASIPSLTHGKLIEYHKQHYHPSNAKILTYGRGPLKFYTESIARSLNGSHQRPSHLDIKAPIELKSGPIHAKTVGPVDPLTSSDRQFRTSTTWYLCSVSDVEEYFSLQVLAALLVNGYGSPAYQSLVQSGMGTDFTSNTGIGNCGKRATFSLGISGVSREDIPRVKTRIHELLNEARQSGFSSAKVNGALHQLELSVKHQSADFGKDLVANLSSSWFTGVDPFDCLAWNRAINTLKKNIAGGKYFESLLDKYLLNDKTLTFTMEPDLEYEYKLSAKEANSLGSKMSSIMQKFGNEETVQEVLENREADLLRIQNQTKSQDLSCLPAMSISDIQRDVTAKKNEETSNGNVKIQWRSAATNGLTYLRAINIFDDLPHGLRKLVPLFCDSIMRLGTKDHTIEELEEMIKLRTGGISVAYHAAALPNAYGKTEEGISISAFAVDENVTYMFGLIQKLILETNFDGPKAEKMLGELIQTNASGAIDAIADSGSSFAITSAEGGISNLGQMNEATSGLTQVGFITQLFSQYSSNSLGEIINQLKKIQSLAISRNASLRMAVTCGRESFGSNERKIATFLDSIPSKPSTSSLSTKLLNINGSQRFIPLPYQVYYSALVVPTVSYTDPDSPSLEIIAELLTHKYLHPEIREKGGAYAANASFRNTDGLFAMSTYRDPDPLRSLKTLKDAGRQFCDRDWTERDIEEAKISLFQQIDAPKSINEEGLGKFIYGIDQGMKQRRRESLLDVAVADVKKVANRVLVKELDKSSNIALIGPRATWISPDQGWQTINIGVCESGAS